MCKIAIANRIQHRNPSQHNNARSWRTSNLQTGGIRVLIKQIELGYDSSVDFSYAPNHNVAKVGGLSGGVLVGGIISVAPSNQIKGSEGVQLITANVANGGLVSFRAGGGQSAGTFVGKDFTNVTWFTPSQLNLEAEETPGRGQA